MSPLPPMSLRCGIGKYTSPGSSTRWLVWAHGNGVGFSKLVTTEGEAVLFLRRWAADRGFTLSSDLKTMDRP